MLKTKTYNMMITPKRKYDSVYLLKGRKLERKEVFVPVPVRVPDGREDITVIQNEGTSRFKGVYRNISPNKMRFHYPDYSFSAENTIVAYNDMYLKEPLSLNTMALDIEVQTDGSLPEPGKNKILTVGYAINDEKVEVLYLKNTAADDRLLIQKLIDVLIKREIMLVSGYYSGGFDLPYILRRAYHVGMESNIMKLCGDSTSLGKLMSDGIYRGENIGSEFGVILHHDLYNEVALDQSLYKLKHRTLKNVGRHFLSGVDPIELEREELTHLGSLYDRDQDKIIKYQASDTEVTRKLMEDVYTSRVIEQSNEMGIPLNVMFRRSSTLILQIELLRRMRRNNLFISCKNNQRFSSMYERARSVQKGKRKKDDEDKPVKAYQGAWTEAFKRGKYKNVHKYDYSGMYTSIITTLNMSHETVSLEEVKPWPEARNEREKQEQQALAREIEVYMPDDLPSVRMITIHDMNQKADIVIKLKVSPRGFIPRILDDLKSKRKDVRKEMENISKDDFRYVQMDSKQDMYKVMGNSTYGLLANEQMPGWLPAGMVTTAMGRHIAGVLIEVIREKLGSDSILELDTDGVLVSGKVDIEYINRKIVNYVSETFKIQKESVQIAVEEEEFDRIFIHRSKNYIIKEKDGSIVIHGSALKSSRMPGVIDRVVDLVISYGIKDEISREELIRQALDIEGLPLSKFIIRQRMSKELIEYKTPTPVTATARELAEKGIADVTKGTDIEYLMLKDELSGQGSPKAIQLIPRDPPIDYDYYRDTIERMLKEMEIISDSEDSKGIGSLIFGNGNQ